MSFHENASCSLPMVSGAEGNTAGLSYASWGESIMLWMLFILLILLGEQAILFPKIWPLTEPWREQRANASPFEEDINILAWMSAPCPAEGQEEDGGSRRRNLCLRHGASSRRQSVAVMQRTPEAPLSLFSGPCREVATAYWGQAGDSCSAPGAAGTSRGPAAQRGEKMAREAAWAVLSHPGKP